MVSFNKSFIYFICLVSAMGGLLFGYDWVVIGGAVKFYEQFFGIGGNAVLQGVATSSALVGCMIGAMVAGALMFTSCANFCMEIRPFNCRISRIL